MSSAIPQIGTHLFCRPCHTSRTPCCCPHDPALPHLVLGLLIGASRPVGGLQQQEALLAAALWVSTVWGKEETVNALWVNCSGLQEQEPLLAAALWVSTVWGKEKTVNALWVNCSEPQEQEPLLATALWVNGTRRGGGLGGYMGAQPQATPPTLHTRSTPRH